MTDERFYVRVPCPTIIPELKTYTRARGLDDPIIQINVPCAGTLRPCPICHQVRFCSREARCLDDAAVTHVVRRRFVIDDVDYGYEGRACTRPSCVAELHTNADPCPDCRNQRRVEVGVPGWTRGARWNGWQCPLFELEGAMAIVDYLNDEGDAVGRAWLDMATDTIHVEMDGQEDELYQGEELETPEGVKHVYALGAFSWVWDAHPW